MDKLAGKDALWRALHGIGKVAEELFLLTVIHQTEQCAGLGVITRAFTRLSDVEAVEVHDLVPGCNEVAHELFLCIVLGIDLGQGAYL